MVENAFYIKLQPYKRNSNNNNELGNQSNNSKSSGKRVHECYSHHGMQGDGW